MRILGFCFFCALGISLASVAAPAAAASRAALVVDANTGETLHAQDADAVRYPASLTKMMTLYLVFDALSSGRASLATRVRASGTAADQPPSKIGLEEGDTITLDAAIRALVVKSANDVAVAVAEHFAGSEAAFARQMTRKAHALGMSRTTFRNASGLPDPNQVTTARDMARLALALQDNHPQFFAYFRQQSFSFRGRLYRNHNRLLGRTAGVDGIKTGYTRSSGFNLATSMRRGRRHLVGVVMGHRTSGERNRAMRRLLAETLLHASARRTRPIRPELVSKPQIVIRPAPQARPTAVATAPRPSRDEQPRLRPSTDTPVQVRASGNGTHQIQVGAFYRGDDAQRHLEEVQARAGRLLDGFQAVALRVHSGERDIYRARFSGFDARTANETCAQLKAVRIDCFVSIRQ